MLELTLAIAIMAILMTAASIALLPRVLRAKSTVTRNTMKTVEQSLDEYRAFNNQYPATLAQLAPEYIKDPPKDGWKRDFQFRAPGAGGMPYDLISAGDDGEFGTADDINIWTIDEDG
jgi:general secretion pathway protein G